MFNVTDMTDSAYIDIDSEMAYLFYFSGGECNCWVYKIGEGVL